MYGCNTDISSHFFRIFNLRPSITHSPFVLYQICFLATFPVRIDKSFGSPIFRDQIHYAPIILLKNHGDTQ